MTLKQRNIGFSDELIEKINEDIIREYRNTGKMFKFVPMVRKRLNEIYGIQGD